MPELPEVETMARGIRSIIGREILKVVLPKCACRPIVIQPSVAAIRRRLVGRTVTEVSRLGKRVVVHVDEQRLFFQPKMSGLVALQDVPSEQHLRFELRFPGRSGKEQSLFYWDRRGLGTIALLHQSEVEAQLVAGKLGPDALAIDPDDFYQRFHVTRRPIKVALLDQKLVAGVGNLYASEMLFAARINPKTRSCDISKKRMRRLFDVMLDILTTAIEYEGSTLSDGTYRTAVNDPGSYQNEHQVYDCAGQICSACGVTEIRRIVQSQRSTFFCPRCQK
ncbi:MAG: formamidopyrimidine-DNA glycosylase [Aureliella sp.]